MVNEGDFVEIPLPDGRTAIGWILHVSEHFKNAVGFLVLGIKGEYSYKNVRPGPTLDVIGPFYTHAAALKHYGWKAYAHQSLSEENRLLTKRRVGGDVYVADDYIGSVEDLNAYELKPMQTMGMPVIYAEIEKAF